MTLHALLLSVVLSLTYPESTRLRIFSGAFAGYAPCLRPICRGLRRQ
jgi:hypothetical protein